MNWTDIHNLVCADQRALARLMQAAWAAAAQHGHPALLSNLAWNTNTPHGICSALDWNCIQVPQDIEQQINAVGPI